MKNLGDFELQHNGGIDVATPGQFAVLWSLLDRSTGQVIAEGKGNTEHLAQQRLKQDLIDHGWEEPDVVALVEGEPDWIV